ncbi:hypothetical protein GCM10017044_15290 [Kordiimonas sediminis]|uniref:Uncharacterized protein n=1 Tax=Kordiimonas sediminis TaxID=1735581 RepID=A0A919AQJ3_9PROT|nr:hypothetical protein [Kordiimonas sediminis]GHF22123.1 hypothetical protein GCM10017044_15290 [Kordiimonas sediminis]
MGGVFAGVSLVPSFSYISDITDISITEVVLVIGIASTSAFLLSMGGAHVVFRRALYKKYGVSLDELRELPKDEQQKLLDDIGF